MPYTTPQINVKIGSKFFYKGTTLKKTTSLGAWKRTRSHTKDAMTLEDTKEDIHTKERSTKKAKLDDVTISSTSEAHQLCI